jgi:ABC-2 type transport system ATP-binding protein
VGLAQALLHRPELVVLDEPMSGLDPLGRALVKDRLRHERSEGRTVLLSSHVLADIEALADRITLIDEGRSVVSGRPGDLLDDGDVVIEGAGPLAPGFRTPGGSVAVEGMDPHSGKGTWSVRLAHPGPEEVEACLRALLDAGAAIERVERTGEDLEAFFLRRIGGGARRGGDVSPDAALVEGSGGEAAGSRAETADSRGSAGGASGRAS